MRSPRSMSKYEYHQLADMRDEDSWLLLALRQGWALIRDRIEYPRNANSLRQHPLIR